MTNLASLYQKAKAEQDRRNQVYINIAREIAGRRKRVGEYIDQYTRRATKSEYLAFLHGLSALNVHNDAFRITSIPFNEDDSILIAHTSFTIPAFGRMNGNFFIIEPVGLKVRIMELIGSDPQFSVYHMNNFTIEGLLMVPLHADLIDDMG